MDFVTASSGKTVREHKGLPVGEEPEVLVSALLMLEFLNPDLKETIENLEDITVEHMDPCKNLKRKNSEASSDDYDTSDEDEPSADCDEEQKRKCKKSRAGVPRKRATAQQVSTLEQYFSVNQFPKGDLIDQIALKTAMPPAKVKNWFQNKRAKERRLLKMTNVPSKSARELARDSLTNAPQALVMPPRVSQQLGSAKKLSVPTGSRPVFLGPSLTDHLNRL